jgi:thymidylate kinase
MSPNNNLSEETRINLCASSLISTYEELVEVNRITKLIIMDRWIPTFYSYQDVMTNSKAQEYFAQYFDYTLGKIPRPDFTFYLDAPDDVILSRLKDKRRNSNLDELDSYYMSNMARINNGYRMFKSLYESDDTSQTLNSYNTIKLIMTDIVKKRIDSLLLSN